MCFAGTFVYGVIVKMKNVKVVFRGLDGKFDTDTKGDMVDDGSPFNTCARVRPERPTDRVSLVPEHAPGRPGVSFFTGAFFICACASKPVAYRDVAPGALLSQ